MIDAHSFSELQLDRPTYLALGAFDGIHIGHQALIGGMIEAAHADGALAAVVTFFPHPSVVLRGRTPSFYIHRPEEKAAMLADLGLDVLVTHPFDDTVAQVRAADFLQKMYDALQMRAIWAGADFAIGHKRGGNLDWLKAHAADFGFVVHPVRSLVVDDDVVSSSRIRTAIRAGDVALAAQLLGRPLRIPGTVVEGEKRGRTIGFPTANLSIWPERAYPGNGVYACWAWLPGRAAPLKAAVNIGVRPTFDSGTGVSIEAHLLDFDGDLYGQALTLDFVARLRAERRFDGIDALIAQIGADAAQARDLLAAAPVPDGENA